MLKFIKHHMTEIDGIEVYPILSLLIFFLFFSALAWWVISSKKEYIDKVSQLPLQNDQTSNANNNLYEN